MTPATNHAVGAAVARFLDLGLRDDLLLLAIGIELEVRENPTDGEWIRAASRVYGRTHSPDGARYWLERVLRHDLPRHVPAHEQSDGPILTCVAPMVRRAFCGREVPLHPMSPRAGTAIPALLGEHVTWHAYCKQHDYIPSPHGSAWSVKRTGTPEAHAAAKRLRHNTGGKLRDAFHYYQVEEGYRWADNRWEPDDRPVETVRLRLVPPLEPAEEGS